MSTEQHMRIVERIVRPIVASHSRKMAMRHELLAHLEASVAEELESGAARDTALQRAQERLGDPDELRATLQATIPAWFQWNAWILQFAVKKPGESNMIFAVRLGCNLTVVFGAYLLLAVAAVCLVQGKPLHMLIPGFMLYLALVFGVTAALVTAVSLWVTTPLVESDEKPTCWNWQTTWGTLAVGLVFGLAVMALTAWSDRDPVALLLATAKGFAGAVLLFPFVCRLFVEERRQSYPWDRLQLDEPVLGTN